MERFRNKVDLGHLPVGNPSAFRIGPFIEPTRNSQPRLGRGCRDQLDNDLMRHQRLAPPVLRDKGKEPMLDLVPLTCSELRTSAALLENISRFLLTITENITGSLLGLGENELAILRTNSQISGSAHNH